MQGGLGGPLLSKRAACVPPKNMKELRREWQALKPQRTDSDLPSATSHMARALFAQNPRGPSSPKSHWLQVFCLASENLPLSLPPPDGQRCVARGTDV